MEITKTLYVPDRAAWREWLAENHVTVPEIWLLYAKKSSGKPGVAYSDAVEEALCFGWIDGLAKKFDADFSAQRFTPRRVKSNWSELNKERVRRLIIAGQMTAAGLAMLPDLSPEKFIIAEDVLAALQADPQIWENFQKFPDAYKRIRIGFIEDRRKYPEDFQKRLVNFLKMTTQNKTFGTMP